MKLIAIILLTALSAGAEVKTMTLRQALQMALQQSPDLVLARLDQEKARYQVTIAHDPFVPKVYAGSGAAKPFGYPLPINGNAPSIFQAQTQMELYNRPQSYQVAIAHENLRGAAIDVAKKQAQVVYQRRIAFSRCREGVTQRRRRRTANGRFETSLRSCAGSRDGRS